jgi:hypothetical protein
MKNTDETRKYIIQWIKPFDFYLFLKIETKLEKDKKKKKKKKKKICHFGTIPIFFSSWEL